MVAVIINIAKTGAIPRRTGAFGIISGIVLPFAWLVYADGELVVIGFIGLMISLIFALISGLWLIGRGTTGPSP